MKKEMAIFGALIGDYYGSYWEFLDRKPTSLEDGLKLRKNRIVYDEIGHVYETDAHKLTDDTVCTLAIASAVLDGFRDGFGVSFKMNCIDNLKRICRKFPSPYGERFYEWVYSDNKEPYGSWGNGASMRVSPVGLASTSLEEAIKKAKESSEVTHNHPFAIVYAEMTSAIIYLAKTNHTMEEIVDVMFKMYPKQMQEVVSLDLEDLHKNYTWHDESSQNTCPQAIYCFISSKSFEDCLARSLYIGGDSDTLCAISCSMASAYYGDDEVAPFVSKLPELPKELDKIVKRFSSKYSK